MLDGLGRCGHRIPMRPPRACGARVC